MDPPAPPALTSARVRALTDQQLYAVITDGFGRMPSYASQLSPADRAAVVAYVRELEALPRDTASTPGFDTIP
jgi:mono/diheme cytochrome c family protein